MISPFYIILMSNILKSFYHHGLKRSLQFKPITRKNLKQVALQQSRIFLEREPVVYSLNLNIEQLSKLIFEPIAYASVKHNLGIAVYDEDKLIASTCNEDVFEPAEIDCINPQSKAICKLLEYIEHKAFDKIGHPQKKGEYLHMVTSAVEKEYGRYGIFTDIKEYIKNDYPNKTNFKKIIAEPTNDYSMKGNEKAGFTEVITIAYTELADKHEDLEIFRHVRKTFHDKFGNDIGEKIGVYQYDLNKKWNIV